MLLYATLQPTTPLYAHLCPPYGPIKVLYHLTQSPIALYGPILHSTDLYTPLHYLCPSAPLYAPLRPTKALLCPSLLLKSTLTSLSSSTLLYAPICSLHSTTAPLKPLLACLWPLYFPLHPSMPPLRPFFSPFCSSTLIYDTPLWSSMSLYAQLCPSKALLSNSMLLYATLQPTTPLYAPLCPLYGPLRSFTALQSFL